MNPTTLYLFPKESQSVHRMRQKLADAEALLDLRREMYEHIEFFLDLRYTPRETIYGVGAWKVGSTHPGEHDDYGWPITLDEQGRLFKGLFPRPYTAFTRRQMKRIIDVLANYREN